MSDQEQQQDIILVNDIEQFVQIMEAWHAAKIGTLKNMMAIPSDGSITLTDQNGDEHRVEGDFYKGFAYALFVALSMFSELPFAETDDEPEKPTH